MIIYLLFLAFIEIRLDIEKTAHPNFQHPDGRPLTWKLWWGGEPNDPNEECASILSREGKQVLVKKGCATDILRLNKLNWSEVDRNFIGTFWQTSSVWRGF